MHEHDRGIDPSVPRQCASTISWCRAPRPACFFPRGTYLAYLWGASPTHLAKPRELRRVRGLPLVAGDRRRLCRQAGLRVVIRAARTAEMPPASTRAPTTTSPAFRGGRRPSARTAVVRGEGPCGRGRGLIGLASSASIRNGLLARCRRIVAATRARAVGCAGALRAGRDARPALLPFGRRRAST